MEVTKFNEPFPHFIFRGVIPGNLIDDALARIPNVHAPWIRYENELEYHKWTLEDPTKLPVAWVILLDELRKTRFINLLEKYTHIPVLQANSRGGGLHAMFPGGYLQTHLDYALHPSGLERRASLILSLNDMSPIFGGATQLCDSNGSVLKKIYLQRNEALVWPCSDISYHGVEPLTKDSPVRYTAASYYLGPARENTTRTRALFIPKR